MNGRAHTFAPVTQVACKGLKKFIFMGSRMRKRDNGLTLPAASDRAATSRNPSPPHRTETQKGV